MSKADDTQRIAVALEKIAEAQLRRAVAEERTASSWEKLVAIVDKAFVIAALEKQGVGR